MTWVYLDLYVHMRKYIHTVYCIHQYAALVKRLAWRWGNLDLSTLDRKFLGADGFLIQPLHPLNFVFLDLARFDADFSVRLQHVSSISKSATGWQFLFKVILRPVLKLLPINANHMYEHIRSSIYLYICFIIIQKYSCSISRTQSPAGVHSDMILFSWRGNLLISI